jgi:hypothetical protein
MHTDKTGARTNFTADRLKNDEMKPLYLGKKKIEPETYNY